MTPPKRWTPGDPITADRLNSSVFESVRPRRDVVLGNGSSLVNESVGNQTANMRRSMIKLVVAVSDFGFGVSATDLNTGVLDDVPSGLVREVRLSRKTGTHGQETLSGDFRVWDPVAGLSGAFCGSDSASCSLSASSSCSLSSSDEVFFSSKLICDVFYVTYNEDSKRWECLQSRDIYPIWAVNIGSLSPATHPLTCHSIGVAGTFVYCGDNLLITDARKTFIRRDSSGTIADGTLIQLDIVSSKLTIVWADCQAHADLEGLVAAP